MTPSRISRRGGILIACSVLLCAACDGSRERVVSKAIWPHPQTIRVAAIQMEAELGEVDRNLERAERLVRRAFEQGAQWVILPEFFSSAIAFHPKMLDAARPADGPPLDLLVSLAREYQGAVGGSFLARRGEHQYNTFALAFPDGRTVFHDKDEPTLWENCYYVAGSDDGVLDTPAGPVGLALCAEMFRTRTARRMAERVGLVLAGSCWWTVPDGAPEAGVEFDRGNRGILRRAPRELARTLGVPVVHASQAGGFEGYHFPSDTAPYRSHYLGETQIVDASGNVLARMAYEDGEGVILADIEAGLLWTPTAPIPERHWIQALPEWFDTKWEREGALGAQYYRSTTLPRLSAQSLGQ